MDDVVIKKSKIRQFPDGKGVFANRDFKKGEVIIKYNLKPLTEEEFESLPESEKEFTHKHWGVIYLYSVPERYVNHTSNPNTVQDLKRKRDIAKRDIKKGEEITTDTTKDEVS
ncbi:MAG: SET domain-containing protein [Nanoarchaeota archaeon]